MATRLIPFLFRTPKVDARPRAGGIYNLVDDAPITQREFLDRYRAAVGGRFVTLSVPLPLFLAGVAPARLLSRLGMPGIEEGASADLGKTAGKDAAAHKPTYPALFGLAESHRLADAALERALEALRGERLSGRLVDIAHWVVRRSS